MPSPPLDFFATCDIGEVLVPSMARQRHRDGAPEREEETGEKPRGITKRLMYALSVLNFAMHTVT